MRVFLPTFKQPSFPAPKPSPFFLSSSCIPVNFTYLLSYSSYYWGRGFFYFVDYPEPSTVPGTYWALNQYLLIMLIKHRKESPWWLGMDLGLLRLLDTLGQ